MTFLAMRLPVSSKRRSNLPRRVSHGMRPVFESRSSSSLCLPMASATAMEGMLVLMFPVGRERVCSGGNGKSLVCAVELREIEVADVLWSLRRFYWD